MALEKQNICVLVAFDFLKLLKALKMNVAAIYSVYDLSHWY